MSARPRPGRVVDAELGPEAVARLGGEQLPADADVAGRIADARAPEIEESGEAPVRREKVAPVESKVCRTRTSRVSSAVTNDS